MSRVAVTLSAVALAASLAFAQGGFDGPGLYEIMNLDSRKLMELDPRDQTTIVQNSPRGTPNRSWEITPAGNGFFYIRSAMNGKALQVSRNANSAPLFANRFDGGSGQQWRMEPGKDGNILIISSVRRTADVPGGTSRDGARLQIYDVNGDANQRFIFRRVGNLGRSDSNRREDQNRDRDRRGGRRDR